MSLAPRALIALVSGLLVALGIAVVPTSTASAASTVLCSGWSGCVAKGYSDAGYGAASGSSYWQMYSGHNCTNYVAYRMISAGMSTTRPFSGTGNAWNWGGQLASKTDQTPSVGAVAWYDKGVGGAGSVGHVAYVEQVVSATEIVISEDSWGGDFHWRRILKGSSWPSGFIHLVDKPIVNTAPATVSGTPQVGQTLTANPGSWSPAAPTAYQWLADGAPISGATGATLKLTSDLGGKAVSLQVVASQAGFTPGTSTTTPVAISLGTLAPQAAPAVEGLGKKPLIGTVLTAKETTFSPAARRLAVQWQADGVPIPGATGWTYTLGAADVQKTVTAVVVGRRPGYSPTPAASAGVGPVVAGRLGAPAGVAVKGRPLVGRTLKVAGGATDPETSTSYTWLRDGKAVRGASGATYTLTPADAGAQMSVILTLAKPGWLSRKASATRATAVATTATLKLKTVGGHGKAVIWFRVDAPGVARPAGPARVTVGGIERTVTVTKGVGRLALTGIGPGKHDVTVRWLGTNTIVAARTAGTVRVKH